MSKKKFKKNKEKERNNFIHPEARASIIAVFSLGLSIVFILSGFDKAGPMGEIIFSVLTSLMGLGYWLLPTTLLVVSFTLFASGAKKVLTITLLGALFIVLAGLGIIDIIYPEKAGLLGRLSGSLETLFGYWASLTLNFTILMASFIVTFNAPIKISTNIFRRIFMRKPEDKEQNEISAIIVKEPEIKTPEAQAEPMPAAAQTETKEKLNDKEMEALPIKNKHIYKTNYALPPLSLLRATSEKPTGGDLRANANIIKRTLENFGIPVEMGEISIGPKVTRYTLKPAEGVKISRITALNQDLSLALAMHPIRIEAPIPGKSLVGIEVPNKVGSIVRLGGLLGYPEFSNSGPLTFPLGRDVSGEPIFANLAKMPHMLIAGATGSGKSVTIHSLIISLLYKNSPETLRFIFIDPKRVELSVYQGLPHLISSVITDGKKAIAALRFAIGEMDKRYDILLKAGSRDISSYNEKRREAPMPYIVIVIDELADLMSAFGREIEGSIVRLAQMARAIGIHLVVSTQRPSVEVITGLIKANITARVALQVASQIDSRTILDMAGAEKLLGGGDMLFTSNDFSKPKRIQGTYIPDEEIKKVSEFIVKENPIESENGLEEAVEKSLAKEDFQDYANSDENDELFDEAVKVVKEAQKASASLLQRRLKVGYARAARLLDIMETRGLISPGEGAKPREVFINADENE